MTEPQWGVELLQQLNTRASSSDMAHSIAAFFADVPVFLLPLFLLWLYFRRGVIKKHFSSKYGALLILFTGAAATVINILIQHHVDKARPETALTGAGHLVMKHLPTASFPSDHAAVSMAIALAVLVRGAMRGKKKVIARGRVLLIASVIMSVARIAVGVHWPTDILAGWSVGVVAVLIMFCKPIRYMFERFLIYPLVQVEERILGVYKRK